MTPVRPPAVPLITHDPYFSIWSFTDQLNESWPRHWTGAGNDICILARIDGDCYRLCGLYKDAPPLAQAGLDVTATRTIYRFRGCGVEIRLTFLTPALCDDLDLLSRPITHIGFDVRAIDGKAHSVDLYVDASAILAVDGSGQAVDAGRLQLGELSVLRTGSTEQRVLTRSGDNLRIEWGYLHLAGDRREFQSAIAMAADARAQFRAQGTLPAADRSIVHRTVKNGWPVMAFAGSLGKVTGKAVSRRLMIAYDDIFGIEYHHRRLRPYWARNGADIAQMLTLADQQYPALARRCAKFDDDLSKELSAAGGERYAALCTLAYRQAITAHKLVADIDGTPLFFSKENFSNGCIATVDVTYPSAPLFLMLQPKLLEGMLTPILDYAMLPRWKHAYAPHDLGQYPLANGQVYGGGETSDVNQMPVEECGNMLILVAALARATGDGSLAQRYWPLLTKWAEYLKAKGLDPESQLCTDDFAGHLGHNTNLSLKAIVSLGAYAKLAGMLKRPKDQRQYQRLAKSMARQWQKMARDGDHYRLTFDSAGTWSQKYNMVWDKVLELGLFPADVARREVAFYLRNQQQYGLPLDSRQTYTKLDWTVWSATLAESQQDFEALIEPLFRWLSETPTRVPMTDWYETTDGKQKAFQARSVVGGLFIKALAERWRT